DYAETLRRWLTQFDDSSQAITELGYSEKFKKLWRFYLAYCIAGFEARSIAVGQYTLER
ncbi:MAG: class I SAM-dependent methyltransferase, partial [Casimicrobium sp.]